MKRFLTYLFCLIAIFPAIAESPRAFLKAEYESMSKTINTNTGDTITNNRDFVLRIGQGQSFYFDPQTNRIDSLENDPQGKIILEQAKDAAMEKAVADMNAGRGETWFEHREKMGINRGSRYKNLKDFNTRAITVWDSQMADRYRYPVEMEDLQWELMDSTKMVLDYECQLAAAEYHGRKWYAWFAPEIPVQDGPWQLCGLPGLIMEAITADGEYGFSIKGLQQCDEPLGDPYENPDKIFKSTRIAVLRMKDYGRRNRAAQVSAMTGGAVNIKPTEYKENIDFIETDYHE
ncbi:MAG: GLPGLI family protein [Muribaculaceae bacterium]|nr:GLPGLI family protein [Muribaculaceae bacterium]